MRQRLATRRWTESGPLRLLLRVLAVALVALVAYTGIQQEQRGNQWFDIADESAHYDYVVKLAHGHIPAWGDTVDQDTMLLWDCLGNSFTGEKGSCALGDRNPGNFAAGGYSYQAQQPPLSYLAYVPGYWASEGLAPVERLDVVRDVGGTILLVLTALLLMGIASAARFGFFRSLVFAAVTLLPPISIHAFSIVSVDAATLVAALAFIWGVLIVRSRPGAVFALVLGAIAGVLLGGAKAYMLLLPIGALVALIVLHYRPPRGSVWSLREMRRFVLRRESLYLLASGVVSGVVSVGFIVVQALRERIPASIVQDALGGFLPRVRFPQWETVVSSFVNLTNGWFGTANGLSSVGQIYPAVNTLVLLCIGVAFARRSMWPAGSRDFATAWLSIAVVFSIGWSVLQFVQGGFNFDTPPRYGLPLLPIAALAVALALGWSRHRVRSTSDPDAGSTRAGTAAL